MVLRDLRPCCLLLAVALVAARSEAGPPASRPDAPAAVGADELEAEVARLARVGSCGSPSFSPDFREVAVVCDLSGVPQVWLVDVRGGWPLQVTTLEDPVGGVRWSPDGQWLAFSLAPGGGMNQQLYLVRPDGTELRRLTDGGKENNWLGPWSRDAKLLGFSSNRREAAAMDAWIHRIESGATALVARNPGVGQLTDLDPDRHRGVLSRVRSRGDNDLFLVDLESGRETLLTPHEPPGSFGGGRLAPDASTVYLSSNAGQDRSAFARVRLDPGGAPGPIETLAERDDAELEDFEVSEDGSTAALLWNAGGRSELAWLDLAAGRLASGPRLPAEIAGSLGFSRDGELVALTVSGAAAPQDVWVIQRKTGAMWPLTLSPRAGVRLETLVRPAFARFKAHDGLELSGWLYEPRTASRPAPYVISFHGGPESQERPRFRAVYQALLARGIGVLAPNVRGSSGFGKRFVNLDNGALREDGIADMRACVDYLVKQGLADPRRIGIMGGSYGGYMTMAGLAFHPELFAAGANLFGIVNFETFFAHTEPWMAAISTVEYGDPATQADLLRRLSPIHKLDAVKAPTLVLHGANDTNVPVVEAEQVVETLRRRGVPVEYVLFPDEGHGFRKAPNRVTADVAIVRWFERWLKAEKR